jgi:3-hydroxyisobutyrate dehydrogenase and related beta-hydroxyacid dehydrogenases
MIKAEYWETAPGNTIKDLNTVCDMGKITSSPMPIASLTTQLYRYLDAQGEASKGQIGLMRLYVRESLDK